MLFGEHAVVYNHPCIVTAVSQRMRAEIEMIDTAEFLLEAPEVKITGYKKNLPLLGTGEIPKGAGFVENAVKNFSEKYPLKTGIKVSTKSEFSAQFGFGSSSASTVCVLKGLAELYNLKLSNKELFDLAYKTVLEVQGKGSGFDVAAAIYGGIIYFVTGGKVIEQLNTEKLPIVVGYAGVKANTPQLINQVGEKLAKHPAKVNKIFDRITELVEEGKKAILLKDYEVLGDLMNLNQKLLEKLGVSITKLDLMIKAALGAGAWGAKLSGAGKGDCMVALVPEEKREAVSKTITEAGGEVVEVEMGAEGAKTEK